MMTLLGGRPALARFIIPLCILHLGLTSVLAAPFAYITGAHTVSVIDTATNTVVATVPVLCPTGVAVHPDGSRVYVTATCSNPGGGNSVWVIDTTINAVVATIPVLSGPTGIAVNPAGTRLWVANNTSGGFVSVIETATNTVVDNVAVGSAPIGVAVHPDGSRVYVTNAGSNTVSVIDTATNSVIATIPVGTIPVGVAVNPAGTRVYVAVSGAPLFPGNTVSVINTETNSVVATVVVGFRPYGIAVNPSGTRVFVANLGDATVSVIDAATNIVVATIPVGDGPVGVAVTPDGTKAYVANSGSSTVSVIDIASNTVVATVPVQNGALAFGQFIGPMKDVVDLKQQFLDAFGELIEIFEPFDPVTKPVEQFITELQEADQMISAARQLPGTTERKQIRISKKILVGLADLAIDIACFFAGVECIQAIIIIPNDCPSPTICLLFPGVKLIQASAFQLFSFEFSAQVEKSVLEFLKPGDRFVTDTPFFGVRPSFSIVEVKNITDPPEFGTIDFKIEGVSILPEPFVAFNARAEVEDNEFEVKGSFTLGTASDGIDPLTEDITLQIGTFITTIPGGSIKKDEKGVFKFEGKIDGVELEVKITPLSSNSFDFKADGEDADLAGTINPVEVVLIIGDDAGLVSVIAEIESEDKEDD